MRNILGRSILSATPFILNREAIHRMFELGDDAGLKHLFSQVDENGLPLDVTLQGAAAEVEHLVPEHLHWTSRQQTDNVEEWPFGDDATIIGEVEHSLYPEFYFAHCDLSRSRDATGLVIGHVVGTKPVARLGENQQSITETLPIIGIDLVQRFVAPPGGEIDIPRIRALFHQLRDRYGMEFGLISFDSFASQESIKNLKDNAFKCENFSVDDNLTGRGCRNRLRMLGHRQSFQDRGCRTVVCSLLQRFRSTFFKSQKGFLAHLLGGYGFNTTWRYSSGQLWTPLQQPSATFTDAACQNTFDASLFGASTCRPFYGNPAAPLDTVGKCTNFAASRLRLGGLLYGCADHYECSAVHLQQHRRCEVLRVALRQRGSQSWPSRADHQQSELEHVQGD